MQYQKKDDLQLKQPISWRRYLFEKKNFIKICLSSSLTNATQKRDFE